MSIIDRKKLSPERRKWKIKKKVWTPLLWSNQSWRDSSRGILIFPKINAKHWITVKRVWKQGWKFQRWTEHLSSTDGKDTKKLAYHQQRTSWPEIKREKLEGSAVSKINWMCAVERGVGCSLP